MKEVAGLDPGAVKILPGDVVVRVGANTIPCRNGPRVPLIPVVELIWPDGERDIQPRPPLRLVWSDKEGSSKPGRSKKYINLCFPDLPDPWVTYRVSEKDRLLFEGLKKKWGMWFLLTSEQSHPEAKSYTVFDDGQFWPGSIYEGLDEFVQVSARKFRANLRSAWREAMQFLKEKAPEHFASYGKKKSRGKIIESIPDVLEELGGALPWIPKKLDHWGKPTRTMHDLIVDRYLEFLKSFATGRKELEDEAVRREFNLLWAWLRRAKIFEISPDAYAELYKATDIYVTEEVCDTQYSDAEKGDPIPPKEERVTMLKRQVEACKHLGFPDHLPFDVCWFALGEPIALSSVQCEYRNIKPDIAASHLHLSYGFLVTDTGEVHEILTTTPKRNGTKSGVRVVTHRIRDDSTRRSDYMGWKEKDVEEHIEKARGWLTNLSFIPWVVLNLIQAVNDHQTTIVSPLRASPQTTSKFKKARTAFEQRKPTPQPFYTVYMKESLIHDVVRLPTGCDRLPPGHRYDRRGSYVHHIQRGPLPMDSKLEKRLLRHKGQDGSRWRIWKDRHMPSKWKKVLRKKRQPPKNRGEWVAILRFWRSDTICGPEDAPYIPSTRKATKGPLAEDRRARLKASNQDAA